MDSETYSNIEIDLNDFTKEQLIRMIIAAHSNNETFNEFIVRTLTKAVDYFEKQAELKKPENFS